jgi:hypothetical protein
MKYIARTIGLAYRVKRRAFALEVDARDLELTS